MSQLLFILSGSIACYKACDAISQLVQRGHCVRTVLTPAAREFVGVATLEGLTREPVATDLFAPGRALEHIDLVRWADATIVCPATANTLNKMAAGIADDLAGSLLLAREPTKPLLLAPAMNPAMWAHPATVAAVARLRAWGALFIAPGAGRTACGEVGEGRLAAPDEIVAGIEAALVGAPAKPSRRLRVLITSGGTAEPIDGVRVITNTSTGETGALIADTFATAGHEVVLLRAQTSRRATHGDVIDETFTTFADLAAALRRLLAGSDFAAVIHAAAVSDFAVESIEIDGVPCAPGTVKLSSERPPVIRLRTNPKLLATFRSLSRNRAVRLVAFKLTRGADASATRTAVDTLFRDGSAELVVHSDLSARAPDGTFPADIWRGDAIIAHCPNRASLATELERWLVGASLDDARAGMKIAVPASGAPANPPAPLVMGH